VLLLFLLHLGVYKTIVSSLAQSWESTTHHICTVYSISKEGYSNDAMSLLFGPGQGADNIPHLRHTSVNRSVSVSHLGESVIDNTSLGCSGVLPFHNTCQYSSPSQIQFNTSLANLTSLAQKWEWLLYSTGDALN
jgi:hypothetical protein